MTYSRSRLISNRVVTTTPGNVTLDRYQFLDLSSAEPNLGTSSNGNILTTNTTGARIWTNNISISSVTTNTLITTTANIGNIGIQGNTITGNVNGLSLSGNVYVGNIFYANGSPFVSSNYGNIQMLANLSANTVANISIEGNITANYFIGNGAYLTGLPSGYANANVISVLANLGSNIILTTGNITGGNIIGNILADTITPYQTPITIFNSNTAVGLPTGNTLQRPTGNQGYTRYNTDTSTVEFYNGSSWVALTNSVTDQVITPNGSTQTYTLNQTTTAAGIIVSINGTLQSPSTAYSVTGNQITFTEIPLTTDIIDVRFIATAMTTVNVDATVVDSGNITVGTGLTIVDSFSSNSYRSAKYTISSANPFDSQIAEIILIQNAGSAYVSTIGNLLTGSNSVTYTANLSNYTVNLVAHGTTGSNQLRVEKTYFLI